MSTKIQWCEETWNPITGCNFKSDGCLNCYAKRIAYRLKGRFGYPEDEPFKVVYHYGKLNLPYKWKKPRMVFVCSMGDFFHEDVKIEWLDDVLDVISATPQHTYLILTKRPENIQEKLYGINVHHYCRNLGSGDFYPNVWLGVTVENNKVLYERVEKLLEAPAAKYFLSCEPLLEEIDLSDFLSSGKIDWVIVGGESGANARNMEPRWARLIRDQCLEYSVPFFMKQMYKKRQIPSDLFIREYLI